MWCFITPLVSRFEHHNSIGWRSHAVKFRGVLSGGTRTTVSGIWPNHQFTKMKQMKTNKTLARLTTFQISLLERLYDRYPADFSFRIVLCDNYRSHTSIVQFTSELFYDNRLKSVGPNVPHQEFAPLSFYVAKGNTFHFIQLLKLDNNHWERSN